VDEVRGVIEGWTPDIDVVMQLSARFYGGLHETVNVAMATRENSPLTGYGLVR
jgi:hypothetical protein